MRPPPLRLDNEREPPAQKIALFLSRPQIEWLAVAAAHFLGSPARRWSARSVSSSPSTARCTDGSRCNTAEGAGAAFVVEGVSPSVSNAQPSAHARRRGAGHSRANGPREGEEAGQPRARAR